MSGSGHELIMAFVARQVGSERTAAEAALTRWLDFRERLPYRNRSLNRNLALAFVASLGRILPTATAQSTRVWVCAYHDWLAQIGMISTNPFIGNPFGG
jgi:hypothetical protein